MAAGMMEKVIMAGRAIANNLAIDAYLESRRAWGSGNEDASSDHFSGHRHCRPGGIGYVRDALQHGACRPLRRDHDRPLDGSSDGMQWKPLSDGWAAGSHGGASANSGATSVA